MAIPVGLANVLVKPDVYSVSLLSSLLPHLSYSKILSAKSRLCLCLVMLMVIPVSLANADVYSVSLFSSLLTFLILGSSRQRTVFVFVL